MNCKYKRPVDWGHNICYKRFVKGFISFVNYKMKALPPLQKVRNILAFLLGIVGIFLILSPFLPLLTSTFQHNTDPREDYAYLGKFAQQHLQVFRDRLEKLKPIPKENTLVIPKIGVNTAIVEGKTEDALNRGIWHRPKGSTPDKGGNTVLAGHRYQYVSGPHTLFSLDKVAIGDRIMLYWEGKEYIYEVFETTVVKPTALEIEHNTKEAIVTIYTCTPIYTTLNRLVVKAKAINI